MDDGLQAKLTLMSLKGECHSTTLLAQTVKNLPATLETWVRSLVWEDPLEKGMAAHSSILAWRIHGQRSLVGCNPWGGLLSLRTGLHSGGWQP